MSISKFPSSASKTPKDSRRLKWRQTTRVISPIKVENCWKWMTIAWHPRHHELGSFLLWDLKVWAVWGMRAGLETRCYHVFCLTLILNTTESCISSFWILRQNVAIEAMNIVSASLEAVCKKHRCTPRRSRRCIPMAASGTEDWSAEIVIKRKESLW